MYNPNLQRENPQLFDLLVRCLDYLRDVSSAVNQGGMQDLEKLQDENRALRGKLRILVDD